MSMAFRWTVFWAVAWCLFVNHYARDLTGALEIEIEAELSLTQTSFQALNSVYFAPNLVTPMMMGIASQWFGASRMLVIACGLAVLGHLLVALGGQNASYSLLLVGRAILGLTYECIDVVPVPILGPLFEDCFGALVGLFNSSLRMGSVTNFIVTPLMYKGGGLHAALWTSGALGLSGFIAAIVADQMVSRRTGQHPESMSVKENLPSPVATASMDTATSSSGQSSNSCLSRVSQTRGLAMFLIYTIVGSLIYASIVPFWFFAGRFIRSKWDYSLQATSAMLMFTEAAMVLFGPPIGCLADAYLKAVRGRFRVLAAFSMAIPLAIIWLVFTPEMAIAPAVPMLLLSLGYTGSITLYWVLSLACIPNEFLACGSGIVGSALNIGAAVLPLLMAQAPSSEAQFLPLICASFVASIISLCCGWCAFTESDHHHGDGIKSEGIPEIQHSPSGSSATNASEV